MREQFSKATKWVGSKLADKAFDLFFVGVIGFMTPTTIALWLYFRGGKAEWIYPWLYFAAGCVASSLALLALSIGLFYVKSVRRRALERAGVAKFLSRDKGFLDHKRDMQKAGDRYRRILVQIGNELGRISQTSLRCGQQFQASESIPGSLGDWWRLRIASKTAARLNKHAQRMEQCLASITDVNVLHTESATGYLTWASSQPDQDIKKLADVGGSLRSVLETTQISITTLEAFRGSQENVRGFPKS